MGVTHYFLGFVRVLVLCAVCMGNLRRVGRGPEGRGEIGIAGGCLKSRMDFLFAMHVAGFRWPPLYYFGYDTSLSIGSANVVHNFCVLDFRCLGWVERVFSGLGSRRVGCLGTSGLAGICVEFERVFLNAHLNLPSFLAMRTRIVGLG